MYVDPFEPSKWLVYLGEPLMWIFIVTNFLLNFSCFCGFMTRKIILFNFLGEELSVYSNLFELFFSSLMIINVINAVFQPITSLSWIWSMDQVVKSVCSGLAWIKQETAPQEQN